MEEIAPLKRSPTLTEGVPNFALGILRGYQASRFSVAIGSS